MRDAQSQLDQLLATCGGTLTAETLHKLLGTAADDRVAELAGAILDKDAAKSLAHVAAAADQGLHLGELLDQLIDYWRGLMLVAAAGPGVKDLPGSEALQERIKAHAGGLSLDTILAGLDVLSTAKSRMRGSSHIQVLVEAAAVRLTRMDDVISIAGLMHQVSTPPQSPTPDTSKKNFLTAPETSVARIGQTVPETNGTPQFDATSDFRIIWEKVSGELGPLRAENLKSMGEPAIFGPNALALRVPDDYSQSYAEETVGQLRSALLKATGKEWAVRLDRAVRVATPKTPNEDSSPATTSTARARDLTQFPLLKKIGDVLGGQLVRMEDGFHPTAVPTAAAPDTGDLPEPPDPDES
jgi:DNA polymerase-3 subunit gamma/tau